DAINDGANLLLSSGTVQSYGEPDYDVNLLVADKSWDQNGQLFVDIFETDGFLGDVMTVNLAFKPFFEVERRKYRFRILNGASSRFFKFSLSDGSPFFLIANDGNLLPRPVLLTQTDELGIAVRYHLLIDFSLYAVGQQLT